MNHFELRPDPAALPASGAGTMWCEGVQLAEIAAKVGTPVYVYSSATLKRHYTVFRDAFAAHPQLGTPLIAYAVKANGNLSVIRTLATAGAGADTVSEGEIRRALAAGVPPQRIIFSGVGKTDSELAYALQVGVAEINVESAPEMDRLAVIAGDAGRPAPLVVRVNPDVVAGGHAKISTGSSHDKFGVSISEAERLYARAFPDARLNPLGLACHIGSQITDLAPLEAAFRKMRSLVERLREAGLPVQRLDLGGGLGVPYFDRPAPPSPAEFAAMVARSVAGLDVELAFEPGRALVANAGVLLSRVIHVHARPEGRRFLVLDAGMNDLLRPALYEAYHEIRPVEPRAGQGRATYDVVGPVCETGDTFTRARLLPELRGGDLVAFMTAGAYGAAMASEYNARPLVPEVLVDGDRWAVVRPRPSYAEMMAREPPAPWLSDDG